jgi:hypothetical protein
VDLFNIGGTFLRKITRFFLRPELTSDGTFLEQVEETSLSSEGVYEIKVSTGLTVLNCGHVIRDHTEIGSQCPYCGSVNCSQCTKVCERCLTTIGNCCTKVLEGQLFCVHCYRILRVKQGAVLTSRVTGKAPGYSQGLITTF